MKKDIYKVAQEYEKRTKKFDAKSAMETYVAALRSLAIIHQQAHWVSAGQPQYGDHLLFQRLYDGVSGNIDTAAEKTIGIFESEMDVSKHISMTSTFVNKFYVEKDLIKRSLIAEKSFLTFSKQLYDDLKQSDSMSLGLDDMIMAIASEHETFVYLLNNRSKKE